MASEILSRASTKPEVLLPGPVNTMALSGFAKKTISMELLKGKNVLISAIIMLTFIHIMDL